MLVDSLPLHWYAENGIQLPVMILLGKQRSTDSMADIKLFHDSVQVGVENTSIEVIFSGTLRSCTKLTKRKWQLGRGPMTAYESGVARALLTHLSELPPLQNRRSSISRATGHTFLLHGSVENGSVTSSDPETGQCFKADYSFPFWAQFSTQSMALRDNLIALGSAWGDIALANVSNRRHIDGGVVGLRRAHLGGPVTALIVLPKIARLLSADASGEVIVFDVKNGTELHQLDAAKVEDATNDFTSIITYLDYDHITERVLVGSCVGSLWTFGSPSSERVLERIAGTEYNDNDWQRPQQITLDPQTGRLTISVEVKYVSDFENDSVFVIMPKSIKRYGISQSGTIEFVASVDSTYTAVAIDATRYDKTQPRFLAVGDSEGSVFIFNSRASQVSQENPTVSCLYAISAPNSEITAVAINPVVLVTGSSDGTAKVYSILNGGLLRTISTPNSRRRRLRPPTGVDEDNSICAISLTPKYKSEVRGVIAFRYGHIRYWNFAPDGVGIVLRSKKRKIHRVSRKEIKEIMDDEIERDVERQVEDENKWKKWEKLNGTIDEEEVAIQIAMMMSREEEERRRTFQPENESYEEREEDEESDEMYYESPLLPAWEKGRKISFGSTSGTASPSGVARRESSRLEDVASFRRARESQEVRERQFEQDLDLAIRLSLAEQESQETSSS
jgi:WD40 repeat protein